MDTTDSDSETDGGKAAKPKKPKKKVPRAKSPKWEKSVTPPPSPLNSPNKSVPPTKSPPKSPAHPAFSTNVNPIPQAGAGGLDISTISTLTAAGKVSCPQDHWI